MINNSFNIKDKKNNQTSVSDADRKILTLGSTDNAGNLVTSFLALSVKPCVEISLSASETNDRFYFSLMSYQ